MGLRGAGLQARLEAKLLPTESGCLEFQGCRTPAGYGHIGAGGRGSGYLITSRAAWMLANGPIPDGLSVLHHCDNPPCCNVDHLFLGTQRDNMRDKQQKGRAIGPGYRGVDHHRAKLTEAQVKEVLRVYATEREAGRRIYGQAKELAERFGVSVATISAIAKGRIWAHLPEQTRRRNSGEIEWD